MLVPQPTGPLMDPMKTTDDKFGRVPRVYIECLKDQALLPELQKKMYTNMPCKTIISMDTGHSSFLSAPGELVRRLVSI